MPRSYRPRTEDVRKREFRERHCRREAETEVSLLLVAVKVYGLVMGSAARGAGMVAHGKPVYPIHPIHLASTHPSSLPFPSYPLASHLFASHRLLLSLNWTRSTLAGIAGSTWHGHITSHHAATTARGRHEVAQGMAKLTNESPAPSRCHRGMPQRRRRRYCRGGRGEE